MVLGILLALGLGGPGQATAKVEVSNPVHEFGEIVEGELLCWDFDLENVGTAELVLGPVATSCACTYVPLARDRLSPGERLWIRVCFDSSGYGGKHVEETASIRTNDPAFPWVRLVLRGYVQPAAPHQAPAKALLSSLYLLLDVRRPEEHAQGHLWGAVNVPWCELPEFLALFPRGLPIFVYGGEEGPQAVALLRSQGLLARLLVGEVHPWLEPFVVGELPPSFQGEGVPVIQAKDLAGRYALVWDFRPTEAFVQGALPGAIRVSPDSVLVLASALPLLDGLPEGVRYRVWLVDEDGKGADGAAQALRQQGVPAVSLVGGLRNWRARYGPTWLVFPFWTKVGEASE